MSNAIHGCVIAAALSCICVSALADTEAGLDKIIITATRIPTAAESVLAQSVVIDRAEIERALPTDIGDVLRTHAGIEIARTGGTGQTTSIFLRGTDSNHTLVLVDGVRINPGTIGVPAIQNIPPEIIDRIEVIKGPLSSIYGTDAIGGVINIITNAPDRTGVSGMAGYGRYDTRAATITGSVAGDAGRASLSGSKLQSDGFAPRTIDPRGGAYDNLSFNLNGSTKLGAVDLGARAWRAAGSMNYLDYSSRDYGNALFSQDYVNSAVSASASYTPVERWRSRLTLSRFVDDVRQGHVQDSFDAAGYESPDFSYTRRYTVDWQNDIALASGQTLTLGTMLSREKTEAVSFGTSFDIDTDVNMFYAQDQLHYGHHTAVLAIGYTDHETFGTKWTWNTDYSYELPTRTRLIGAWGTAFHAPDSTDRFGYGGNPNLKPESSRNLEFTIRQPLGMSQQVSLSAFRNDVTDLIEFVTTDFVTFVGENQNVGRARIEGIELAYELNTDHWRARLEAIEQDPKNRDTDQRLLRRAKHNFTAALTRRFAVAEFGAELLTAGEREDYGYPQNVTLGGYSLVNITARWFVTNSLSLQARLDNAFDKRYELADTYNTARRGVFVSVRYAPRQ